MAEKVRRRVFPELRIKNTHVLARIGGAVLLLIGIGLVIGNVIAALREPEAKRLLFGMIGLAMIYGGLDVAGLNLGEWLFALIYRRTWQRGQSTADGQIIARDIKKSVDEEGQVTYRYFVRVRFESAEGPVVLKARVDKTQYERLQGTDSVEVRYALGNPRLAILEGELE